MTTHSSAPARRGVGGPPPQAEQPAQRQRRRESGRGVLHDPDLVYLSRPDIRRIATLTRELYWAAHGLTATLARHERQIDELERMEEAGDDVSRSITMQDWAENLLLLAPKITAFAAEARAAVAELPAMVTWLEGIASVLETPQMVAWRERHEAERARRFAGVG